MHMSVGFAYEETSRESWKSLILYISFYISNYINVCIACPVFPQYLDKAAFQIRGISFVAEYFSSVFIWAYNR